MAAGARISVTTTKHSYDLYDTVDNLPTIDDKALTPRYILRVDGAAVNPAIDPTPVAGYQKFTVALKAFYRMVRYFERR